MNIIFKMALIDRLFFS